MSVGSTEPRTAVLSSFQRGWLRGAYSSVAGRAEVEGRGQPAVYVAYLRADALWQQITHCYAEYVLDGSDTAVWALPVLQVARRYRQAAWAAWQAEEARAVSDLASFLLDCIAEDEMTASRAGGELWMADEGAVRAADDGAVVVVEPTRHNQQFLDDAAHIARWDPARVLAECEARRRIVELHKAVQHTDRALGIIDVTVCCLCHGVMDAPDDDGDDDWSYPLVQMLFPCATLRAVALPYADRPGYREEWR